ncbi:NAD-dependent epimerase/dehydratase family protein [Algibacter miyuki]|uniref:NAD-dependent epimerase/dehydratase family protein n=1 Tax=Algibacter miyuki TaxID=1306933 RepID=A0ABV5GWE6_9FLAO|nr:NAD-dependent epimerase/dehydratase family protein [Algibacter miyuki]MDN3665261.1 NAD-dependent epimerase/dehydratase family protein [Algibacter miyuki]
MILVTGGTGLVGAHLLYKLASQKETVRAIYRNERKLQHVKNVFATYGDGVDVLFNSITWLQADLLDIPTLTEAFSGVTKVYHCAAFVSFEPNKYQLLRRTNIDGTANIVNLCLAEKVEKLCYVSSIATLGSELNNKPVSEETVWNPEDENSVYGITKYGAEMEVWRGTQEGLNAVIVNPGVILGAGIWHYGTGNLFERAKKGIPYYTSGTIALVAIDDVIRAMVTLMESDIINERFVLVSEHVPYKQFLENLALSVNGKPAKKQASRWFLNLGWRLDWLKTQLTGKRRQLTRHLVDTLESDTRYESGKIKTALKFEFKAVDTVILKIGHLYQKSV